MADYGAVRDGLKAALETIDGLRVHDTAPETIVPPAVVIAPADGVFLEYDTTMDGDSDDMSFLLLLLVDRRSERAAQDELDAYLAKTGDRSIVAAFAAGAVAGTQIAEVTSARGYGGYTYAGEQFLGCQFAVFVGVV